MERTVHQTAVSFLDVVGPALEAREEEHNLLLGIALARLDEELAGEANNPIYLAHLGPASQPDAALLMTPPYPLILSPITRSYAEIAQVAVGAAADSGLRVHGVNSTNGVAELFADTWRREVNAASIRHVDQQRLYVTRSVANIPLRDGVLEPARPEHFPILVDWFRAFHNESLPQQQESDYARIVGQRIEHGTLFIWTEEGEPIGMAGSSRPTRRTVCLSAVYTPPEHRGKGVATSSVASLTKLLLQEFQSCVLFTDLANSTSNAIYQRIGYYGIQDSTLIYFG